MVIDASSRVCFRSASGTPTCPRSIPGLLIRRSPPRLLTAAARTGLRPAPESQSRWAYHHLLRSFTPRFSVQFIAELLSVPLRHTSTFPRARRRADLSGVFRIPDRSLPVVPADAARPVEEGMGSVGIDVDLDPRLDEVRTQRAFGDLQFERAVGHAIVVAHLALLLDAQDLVEIDARDRGEGQAGLSRRCGEALIVGGQIDLADEGVGRLDRRDPGEPELLDQPVLQGLERALGAPASLWRIGPNMLDAELPERAAHLRRPAAIDLAARLGGVEVMRPPVRIEAHRQPVRAESLAERPEGRSRAFLLDQKRRIDRSRRVVQRHNQIERRLAFEPDVTRAVLMQHHPRHRPTRPLAPMRAAPLRLLQKTLRMKERLRPGVAPGEVVPRHQMLMKVLGGEAPVTLAIQSLDLVRAIDRNPLARRLAEPTIQKPRLAVVLKPLTPTSKRPLIDPKQLRCLHLVELRRLVAAQNVKKPHHTHTLKGFRPAHQIPRKGADATGQIVCYVIRTYRVLATPLRFPADNPEGPSHAKAQTRKKWTRGFRPRPRLHGHDFLLRSARRQGGDDFAHPRGRRTRRHLLRYGRSLWPLQQRGTRGRSARPLQGESRDRHQVRIRA